VRPSEERSDELTATILTTRTARAWTSVQEALLGLTAKTLTIMTTLFAIRFTHRRVMVLLALTAIMITVICLVRFLHPGSKFGPESPGIFTLWYVLMITICWLLAFLLRLFVHLSTKSLVKQKDSKAKDILKIVDRAFLVFPILLTLGWIISWISGCVANSLESFDLPRQRDNIDGMMKPNPFKTWTMCSYYFLLLMCWLSFSFVLFVQLLSALESVTIAFRGIGKDIWGDLKGHQTLIEAKTNLKKLILFLFLLGCVLGGSTFFALTVPNHAKYFVWLLVCLFVAYPVTAIPCGWLFFKTFVRKTRTGRMLSVAGSGTHNRPSSAGATPKRETKSGTSLKIDESEEGAEKLTTIRISMHAAHHDPSFHL